MQAVDPRAATEFVKQGGLLIADTRTAIQDKDEAFADTAAWDALFGITRAKPQAEKAEQEKQVYLHSEIPVTIEANGPIEAVSGWKNDALSGEPGLKLVAGQAVANARYAAVAGQGQGTPWVDDFTGSPALITRKQDKGTAVFLNFRLASDYLNAIKQGSPEWDRYKARRAANAKLLAGLLSLAKCENYNVKATAADGSPLPYATYHAFRQDGQRLFGIIQQTHLNLPDRKNEDKSTERYFLRGAEEFDPKPATVVFPENGHVYDVRTKKYLGQADRVGTQITPGRAELYAVLDYRVAGLTLDVPATADAGKPFEVKASLQVEAAAPGGAAPGRHAIRIEWLDPSGTAVSHYRQIITGIGGGAGWMQFALNDVPGKWTVRATDVISGVSVTQAVKVKTPKLTEFERTVPARPGYTVTHEPFAFDPLKGAANPGGVTPAAPKDPQAEKTPPLVSLGEPFIEQKGCFIYFPGQPYHQVTQDFEATFSPGPVEYKLKWVGHRGGCDYTKTVKPSDEPVKDSALGIEGPAGENWLSWNKLGFISIALDGQDVKTSCCKAAKVGDGAVDLTWETAKGTVVLRLAAVKGREELPARLTIKAKEQIEKPIITLHNRAGGVSPVGEFWYVATAKRDDVLGTDLGLPDESWAVFADRAMNRAQNRGAGVSALVIAPDPEQVKQVNVAKVGDKPEPTSTDTRHNRYSHMINTTITLAPVAAGGTRSFSFAIWERADKTNDEARKYLAEKAQEIIKGLTDFQE